MTMPANDVMVVGRRGRDLFFLRKQEPKCFTWYSNESPTEVGAESLEEAIRLAYQTWKGFTPLPCGHVFTLPERDEHGNDALFYQMAKSLASPSGIYFDEELGHNCIVKEIPLDTIQMVKSSAFH